MLKRDNLGVIIIAIIITGGLALVAYLLYKLFEWVFTGPSTHKVGRILVGTYVGFFVVLYVIGAFAGWLH